MGTKGDAVAESVAVVAPAVREAIATASIELLLPGGLLSPYDHLSSWPPASGPVIGGNYSIPASEIKCNGSVGASGA